MTPEEQSKNVFTNRISWGMIIFIVVGITVQDIVAENLPSTMSFWPRFAIKVAAGFIAIMIAVGVWRLISGKKS